MRHFIHKDILIKYFYRKVIQVWKHVSDSASADSIAPCSKTSLDSIAYRINSECFILTFRGLPSLAPNLPPCLSLITSSLHTSHSVMLAATQIISVLFLFPSRLPLPMKITLGFQGVCSLALHPCSPIPGMLLPSACHFFQLDHGQISVVTAAFHNFFQ